MNPFEIISKDLRKNGWAQIQNILSSDQLKEMSSFFSHHREEFTLASIGYGQNRNQVESIRGDFTLWVDNIQNEGVLNYPLTFLEELRVHLNRELFLGLKDFQCHLAFYPSGTFYNRHRDRFNNDSSRSLSFIFYLHEEWNKADGGELILYDQGDKILNTIIPDPGSFVCFLSEDFPHEVKVAHKERRSLTGWMHTKIVN